MENTKKSSLITKKDLLVAAIRWVWFYYPACSYVNYYGIGFCWSLLPILKKLYKDDKEEYKKALARETSFFITESGFGAVINGIIIAMEEERANGNDIPDDAYVTLKSALMGPMAGFGDSIMDSIVRTMLIAISQPLAAQGLAISLLVGPGIKFFCKPVAALVMLPLGYSTGRNAIDDLLDNGMFQKVLSGAAVLSMFIMGSMSASYVSLSTPLTIGNIAIQDIINTALPGILPLAAVWICYQLISKKNVSVVKIIIGIMVVCLLGSLIGIL